jgi:uncharacterized protein (TIGR02145 family)
MIKKYTLVFLVLIALFGCEKDPDVDFVAVNKWDGTTGTFIDARDNETYKWVKIGTQVWMAENLRATTYNDGTIIPNVTYHTTWKNLTSGAYCWYDNDAATYKATYGALYNWYAVKTGKLAPTGWHVPTDAEWTTLQKYLGLEAVAGGHLKSTTGWNSSNTGADNSSGFSALPGDGVGYYGNWWSSTEYSSSLAWGRGLYYDNGSLGRGSNYKYLGCSVRCVRD